MVVGDLLYSQLLYPGMLDARVPAARIAATLDRYAQRLTDSVVARLHMSAPDGVVVHIHDPACWWPEGNQLVSLDATLARVAAGPLEEALDRLRRPTGCDITTAVDRLGVRPIDTDAWHWPFAPGVDYLVVAMVAQASISYHRGLDHEIVTSPST